MNTRKPKLTKDARNKLLQELGRTVFIIEDVKINGKYQFKCGICDYEWWASFSYVYKRGGGCPKCSGVARVTESEAYERLSNRNLTMISWGGSTMKKSTFKCNNCSHEWKSAYSDVDNKGRGCPKCGGTLKLDYNECCRRLNGTNISMLKWGGTTHKKSTFRCNSCSYEWDAKYNNIHNGTNCPSCNSKGGFNPSKPAYVYVLLLDTPQGACYGFGITNNYKARIREHRNNLGDIIDAEYELRYFDSGLDARQLELRWKQSPYVTNINVEGFRTECVLVNADTTKMIFG